MLKASSTTRNRNQKIRNRRDISPNQTEPSTRHGRYNHALVPRFSAELVATALKDTPVVMVTGPRQCGKTTLVRDLVAGNREFITMDDDTVLAAARSDPTGLVRALDRTTI
jgi:predicted AAA+ superfamily ATPase